MNGTGIEEGGYFGQQFTGRNQANRLFGPRYENETPDIQVWFIFLIIHICQSLSNREHESNANMAKDILTAC